MVYCSSLFLLAVILTTQHEAFAGHVIGIDLGTSYSRVAVYRNGEVEIIPNKRGKLHTPSYVAFSGSSVLRGDDAKDQFHLNPENTIYSFKRYLGNTYEGVEEWLTTYEVVKHNGRAAFQVDYKGTKTTFTPEEVAAQLLIELKESAEVYLGSKVTDVVISVSGGSYNLQRQATLDAAKIAGLNVVRLINAATATAVESSTTAGFEEEIVAIVDIGGGAPDFNIGFMGDEYFDTGGVAGIAQSASGDVIDNYIMEDIVHKVKRKFNVDLTRQPHTVQQLITISESAKIALSSAYETTVTITSGAREMSVTVSQATLEEAVSDVMQKLLVEMQDVMISIGNFAIEVDRLIVVGGSTRMRFVSGELSRFFGPYTFIEYMAEFTVATGAAMVGAMERGVMPQAFVTEIMPRTIGIEGVGDNILPVIRRYSNIPRVTPETLATTSDGADVISADVYEGNGDWNQFNHLLGSIRISGIPPGQPRGLQVTVNFEVDHNGICDFTLRDSRYDLSVENGRLSEDEIRNMAEKAQLL